MNRNEQINKLVDAFCDGRISRRQFIKNTMALGLSMSGVTALLASRVPVVILPAAPGAVATPAPAVTATPTVIYPDPQLWSTPRPLEPIGPERYIPPAPGEWKEQIQAWIEKKKKERERGGQNEERRPYPYLRVRDLSAGIAPVNVQSSAGVYMGNYGNFPALTCYVEIYEGPTGYNHPLSDYELRGKTIITVQPGEKPTVELPWIRRQRTGHLVAICYDPLLDPKDFVLVEEYNRHLGHSEYYNQE